MGTDGRCRRERDGDDSRRQSRHCVGILRQHQRCDGAGHNVTRRGIGCRVPVRPSERCAGLRTAGSDPEPEHRRQGGVRHRVHLQRRFHQAVRELRRRVLSRSELRLDQLARGLPRRHLWRIRCCRRRLHRPPRARVPYRRRLPGKQTDQLASVHRVLDGSDRNVAAQHHRWLRRLRRTAVSDAVQLVSHPRCRQRQRRDAGCLVGHRQRQIHRRGWGVPLGQRHAATGPGPLRDPVGASRQGRPCSRWYQLRPEGRRTAQRHGAGGVAVEL